MVHCIAFRCFKFVPYCLEEGHVVAQLAEALRYKPEGRKFDSL